MHKAKSRVRTSSGKERDLFVEGEMKTIGRQYCFLALQHGTFAKWEEFCEHCE